ncbi:MAG: hypothetical protein OXN83_04070 [Oligoflexia bacterium]|nr:hypothetical protein [Oligoflexia bacterium]
MNKKLIIKLCPYFFLCLLLNSLALAEMSDEQKRSFIESLAETSQEKRVFYRWQSKKVANNLLRAGEMTPQLYEHFMRKNDPWAGAGIYVAEDISSSSQFGNTLIQVELEPGYKYLDLLDEKVVKKLEAKGLSIEDVYRLNPRVAVRDIKERKPYWTLKKREGLKFQPVSIENLSIASSRDMRTILLRFERELRNSEHRAQILRKGTSLIQSTEDGAKLLKLAGKYLNPTEKEQIVRKSISMIKDTLHGARLLIDAKEYLNPTEREQIVKKSVSLIQSTEDGVRLLRWTENTLNPTEREQIVRKSASLIQSVEDGAKLLIDTKEYLNPAEKDQIMRKTISRIQTADEGNRFFRYTMTLLTPEEYKVVANKTLSLVQTAQEGIDILLSRWIREYLTPKEQKILLSKTLSLIQTVDQGERLLKAGDSFKPQVKKQIAHRILELNGDLTELKELLTDEEYRAVKTEYENSSRRIKARLNCLKRQLSSL